MSEWSVEMAEREWRELSSHSPYSDYEAWAELHAEKLIAAAKERDAFADKLSLCEANTVNATEWLAEKERADALLAQVAEGLSFARLRDANTRRCAEVFYPLHEWSPNDWATALAGEVGEALNLLKKRRRGEAIPDRAIADELADVVIYLDLLAARLGIDLAVAVALKFNEVSARRGSSVALSAESPDTAAAARAHDDDVRRKALEEAARIAERASTWSGVIGNRGAAVAESIRAAATEEPTT